MTQRKDFYHPQGEDPDVLEPMTREQSRAAARRAHQALEQKRREGKLAPPQDPVAWWLKPHPVRWG
jgi:hypothetical protein